MQNRFKESQPSINLAIVITLDDPENRPENVNRVQVRIPTYHGPLKREDLPADCINSPYVEDEDLPWAAVCYPLGTEEPDKHEFLKELEMVYIAHPSGDIKYPLIIGTVGELVNE